MPERVLLIDDDADFLAVLQRGLRLRGYAVLTAANAAQARQQARAHAPDCVVVDLKLAGESGLELIAELRTLIPGARILMLTGYASIATAVEAVKRGADNYLAKPAGVMEILQALRGGDAPAAGVESVRPLSLSRLEWEHIQRVLNEHAGNISATARALKMHRRTLQRKLAKRPARE